DVVRVEFDGLLITGDGPVQLPLVTPGIAQVEVKLGLLRFEGDGLLEAVDGRVVILLLVAPQRAQAGVCPGELRVEVEGLVESGECPGHPGPARAGQGRVCVGGGRYPGRARWPFRNGRWPRRAGPPLTGQCPGYHAHRRISAAGPRRPSGTAPRRSDPVG